MDGECSLLERSLDALDDIFYVYGANGRLVHWNRRLNELFGLSDAELDGMLPSGASRSSTAGRSPSRRVPPAACGSASTPAPTEAAQTPYSQTMPSVVTAVNSNCSGAPTRAKSVNL